MAFFLTENEKYPSSFSGSWSPVSKIDVLENSEDIGCFDIKST